MQAGAVSEIMQRRGAGAPTVTELSTDELMLLALEHWLNPAGDKPFDPAIVTHVYHNKTRGLAFQRIMVLEFSQFLEK